MRQFAETTLIKLSEVEKELDIAAMIGAIDINTKNEKKEYILYGYLPVYPTPEGYIGRQHQALIIDCLEMYAYTKGCLPNVYPNKTREGDVFYGREGDVFYGFGFSGVNGMIGAIKPTRLEAALEAFNERFLKDLIKRYLPAIVQNACGESTSVDAIQFDGDYKRRCEIEFLVNIQVETVTRSLMEVMPNLFAALEMEFKDSYLSYPVRYRTALSDAVREILRDNYNYV